MSQTEFTINTEGPGLYEFTGEVRDWLSGRAPAF